MRTLLVLLVVGAGPGVEKLRVEPPLANRTGSQRYPVVACEPASVSDGGCLTSSAQSIGGKKSFAHGIETGFIDAGTVRAVQLEGQGASISALFKARPTAAGVAFDFYTEPLSGDGVLFVVNNGVSPRFELDYAGNAQFAGGVTAGGTVTLSGLASGEAAMQAASGLYLPLAGRLPLAYWGHHGAVTLMNSNPMMAGYIAEFLNPESGAATDKKLAVNYQGGITQFGAYTTATFAPCGNYDNAPVNDGGAGYYVATDAGVAQDGTLMFDVSTHRWYQCVVTSPPAGSWVKVTLVGD